MNDRVHSCVYCGRPTDGCCCDRCAKPDPVCPDCLDNDDGICPACLEVLCPAIGPNPKQAYGDAKLKVQLVPTSLLAYAAIGLGEGAGKYGPFNWRDQPVEMMTYIGAVQRHLMAFIEGEDIDPDSAVGKPHLAGAVSSLAVLIDAIESGTAIDNRPAVKCEGTLNRLTQGAAHAADKTG